MKQSHELKGFYKRETNIRNNILPSKGKVGTKLAITIVVNII